MDTIETRYHEAIASLRQAIDDAVAEVESVIEDLRTEFSVARVSRIVARERVEAMVRDLELPEEDAEELSGLLTPWGVGVSYVVGDVRSHDSRIWICQVDHISQEDWTPDVAVSLWALYRQGGTVNAWVQPDGAGGPNLPYDEGERVSHDGRIWRSLVDNNVWEPGTNETLWEDEGEL